MGIRKSGVSLRKNGFVDGEGNCGSAELPTCRLENRSYLRFAGRVVPRSPRDRCCELQRRRDPSAEAASGGQPLEVAHNWQRECRVACARRGRHDSSVTRARAPAPRGFRAIAEVRGCGRGRRIRLRSWRARPARARRWRARARYRRRFPGGRRSGRRCSGEPGSPSTGRSRR